MNIKTPLLIIVFGCTLKLYAQTNQPPVNYFVLVTNLWYQGYKTNVLAIAEQRLAANSNDLAGLILKMEYNTAFSNVESFSNDINSVIHAIKNSIGTNYNDKIKFLMSDLNYSLDLLATEYRPTPEELAQDKAKFYIIHKPMTYEVPLKALHDDGLF